MRGTFGLGLLAVHGPTERSRDRRRKAVRSSNDPRRKSYPARFHAAHAIEVRFGLSRAGGRRRRALHHGIRRRGRPRTPGVGLGAAARGGEGPALPRSLPMACAGSLMPQLAREVAHRGIASAVVDGELRAAARPARGARPGEAAAGTAPPSRVRRGAVRGRHLHLRPHRAVRAGLRAGRLLRRASDRSPLRQAPGRSRPAVSCCRSAGLPQ